jgi:hypothetical protein
MIKADPGYRKEFWMNKSSELVIPFMKIENKLHSGHIGSILDFVYMMQVGWKFITKYHLLKNTIWLYRVDIAIRQGCINLFQSTRCRKLHIDQKPIASENTPSDNVLLNNQTNLLLWFYFSIFLFIKKYWNIYARNKKITSIQIIGLFQHLFNFYLHDNNLFCLVKQISNCQLIQSPFISLCFQITWIQWSSQDFFSSG